MASLTLDKYRFVQRLTQEGMSENQAKALAEELQQINLEHVTTKEDLLKLEMKLMAKIDDTFRHFLMWLIPLLLGQVAIFAAIVKWV